MQLGGGGMGNVYLAREQGLYGFEKLWAVKLIRPSMEERSEFRAMFMDEARLMARLHHPAIPQIHRFGEADEMLYMVMEYVAGESFASILASGTPRIPPLIACSLIAKVCRGLHAAHELTDDAGAPMNVVHRDVSPSNLVLTFEGGVKILDFGIALMRERRAPVTGVGIIKGKPSYVAPEQFNRRVTDRRADIFSVSIVLWELLTKRKLIDTFDLVQIGFDRALSQAVCPPSSVVGPLPAGLDELVLKGLAESPADRFENAREMARELETLIEREGCEPLEEFAARELEPLRTAHATRIRELRAGNAVAAVWQPPPITQVDSGAGLNTQPTQPDAPRALDASRTYVLPLTGAGKTTQRIVVLVLGVLLLLVSSWLLGGSEKNDAAPALSKHAPLPPAAPPPEAPVPIEVDPPPPISAEVAPPVPEVPPKKATVRVAPATKRQARRDPKTRAARGARESSPQNKPKKGLISEW
jgi:serine/threonine-protein kinase